MREIRSSGICAEGTEQFVSLPRPRVAPRLSREELEGPGGPLRADVARASHAELAAPMQALTESSLGILLVAGLFTRPAAIIAFAFLGSLWVSEWGTAWIWELLVPVLASLARAVGRAGRAWGIDALLARRWPSSRWW